MQTGTIYANCPECDAECFVKVTFPAYNQGFTPKECVCHICGVRFVVTDPHQYNEDGTIKETNHGKIR